MADFPELQDCGTLRQVRRRQFASLLLTGLLLALHPKLGGKLTVEGWGGVAGGAVGFCHDDLDRGAQT